MAIGVLACAWDPSSLLNELTVMLIREVMGFHAQIDSRVGKNSLSSIYALAGCADFDAESESDKNCGTQETNIHISMDSWVSSYASTQQSFAQKYPDIAAEDLGSMGYSGETGMFVRRSVLDAAYSDTGLALDFYKRSLLDSLMQF